MSTMKLMLEADWLQGRTTIGTKVRELDDRGQWVWKDRRPVCFCCDTPTCEYEV